MRYIFKILILGLDGEAIALYTIRAFGEEGENKGPYLELYKEVKILEDTCDLEVNAIIDVENTDLDELINTVDGIIYFINPLKNEEKEVFNSILHDIRKTSRNIPIVIMYYDLEGTFPLSVNDMLENSWLKYFDIEAFVNVRPREFHQVLHCLCIAMISGDSPLNIENAWMRYPIYIQLANIYFKKAEKQSKPEYYFYSAQAVKKAAMIADIFNKEEYYVICEQAAFLFSKVNLYLEAANILQNVDKKKAENFKRLHAESMIREGNKLFNKHTFDEAARQYEAAAQWAALEYEDEELKNEAFKLAITSWISACKVENFFKIIKNLTHDLTQEILQDFLVKILAMVDFLIKEQKLLLARDQLRTSVDVYQKRNLSEELHELVTKLIDVLKLLLARQILEEDRFSANGYFSEIKSVCRTYDLELPNHDQELEVLINLFKDNLEFENTSPLLNEIHSKKLKEELTEVISKKEDENRELLKQQKKEHLRENVAILNSYIEQELQIIAESNVKTIKASNVLIERGEYLKAANLVKSQADFWRTIGREEIQDQMLKKVIDILLIGKNFDRFTKVYYELINKTRKIYLRNKLALIKMRLREFEEEQDFEEVFNVFIFFISIFREQSLFDQSKEIAELSINYIKSEAFRIVSETEDKKAIDLTMGLISKAIEFSNAYLDNREENFDNVYEKIIKIYLKLGKFSIAHALTDIIKDKSLKKKLNEKIQKAESEKNVIVVEKAQKDYDEKKLKERESIIKNRAREAQQDKKAEFKERNGLRRSLYDKGLKFLRDNDLEGALKECKARIKFFLGRKRLNLVGISLAVSFLIHYKLKRIEEFEKSLDEIKNSLSSLKKSFSETFPVTLLEYIIEIEKLGDVIKFKEALQYVENLALFEEELDLLYELLDKSKKPTDTEDNEHKIAEKEKKLKIIQELKEQITKDKRDIAKRKLMKNQYWKISYEDLCNGKLKVAGDEYDDTISKLLDKGFFKQAAVSLIITTVIMVKNKNVSLAKSYLNEILTRYSKYKKEFENLPEIQILSELLFALEKKEDELVDLGISSLTDKLVLFECETNLLKSLFPEEQKREIEEVKLSREELAKQKQFNIQLDQMFGIIQKKMPDVRREKQEHLKKRTLMKNRIYTDVVTLLNKNAFKDAGMEYLKLAYTLSKRKNFESGSLMVLLHGLALLIAKQPLAEIRTNINSYLSSLGLNKKLLEDTYPIRCIEFLLNVISYNVEKYLPTIKEILEILPLFEEEKNLIDNW
ncbi:MAG: hypothetical protein KGD74_01980 [Candidatus Lokiarchaeota archaeon]|nr:hypothetical protein [Candidatus Lokiarchaeota archaeon]